MQIYLLESEEDEFSHLTHNSTIVAAFYTEVQVNKFHFHHKDDDKIKDTWFVRS